MTLALPEFVRRFCLHLLPERFVKIRHYGLLGNRGRQTRIAPGPRSIGSCADTGGSDSSGGQTGPREGSPTTMSALRGARFGMDR